MASSGPASRARANLARLHRCSHFGTDKKTYLGLSRSGKKSTSRLCLRSQIRLWLTSYTLGKRKTSKRSQTFSQVRTLTSMSLSGSLTTLHGPSTAQKCEDRAEHTAWRTWTRTTTYTWTSGHQLGRNGAPVATTRPCLGTLTTTGLKPTIGMRPPTNSLWDSVTTLTASTRPYGVQATTGLLTRITALLWRLTLTLRMVNSSWRWTRRSIQRSQILNLQSKSLKSPKINIFQMAVRRRRRRITGRFCEAWRGRRQGLRRSRCLSRKELKKETRKIQITNRIQRHLLLLSLFQIFYWLALASL